MFLNQTDRVVSNLSHESRSVPSDEGNDLRLSIRFKPLNDIQSLAFAHANPTDGPRTMRNLYFLSRGFLEQGISEDGGDYGRENSPGGGKIATMSRHFLGKNAAWIDFTAFSNSGESGLDQS